MEDHKTQEKEKKVIQYHLVRHKWPDEIKEERDKRIKRLLLVLLCVGCFLCGFLVNGITSTQAHSSSFSKLDKVYDLMLHDWYFGKDDEDLANTLLNNAINGLVNNKVDPHTMYMSADESEQFITSLQGNFVGIGIQYYAVDEDTAMVDRVFKGSGAEAGGMMQGDIIIKVDGKNCKGLTLDEISAMIKGEEGTIVKITVLRENEEKELSITRSVVNDSVYGYEKGNAGILEINTFAETSGQETQKYLSYFKEKGLSNLVIDLRDNGGGYVTAAMQIGSFLVPEGSIIYKEQSKDGTITEQPAYAKYEKFTFDKIVILINEDTASASEVLTSCLSEQMENVEIVGTKSYGKGTVQLPVAFEDGSSIKYTVAEWLSPQEHHINGVGITPDYEVELDPAVTTGVLSLEDGAAYNADTVSPYAKPVQIYLKFLGYAVDRSDEYFSITSSQALKQYQKDHNLSAEGIINEESINSLLSSCSLKWHKEKDTLDTQMLQALSLLS